MKGKRPEDIECKYIQSSQAFRQPKWTMLNSQLLGGHRHVAGTGLLSAAQHCKGEGTSRFAEDRAVACSQGWTAATGVILGWHGFSVNKANVSN